jgi:hypothetical protein
MLRRGDLARLGSMSIAKQQVSDAAEPSSYAPRGERLLPLAAVMRCEEARMRPRHWRS